jgi:subtilisin family serine protease
MPWAVSTANAEQPASPRAGRFSVTLVTGDTVTVSAAPGGRHVVTVKMGRGREKIPYTTRRAGERLMVTPADALPLLAADRLDARLFDVLLLRRLGYDDSRRSDLPLMVTGGPAPRGATAVRSLPRLGVTALRERKRDAAEFWAARTRMRGKLWLVGKRRPTLDRSVPQVGAPAAWKAGHVGKGVKVAVLDTGYDAKHPDLGGGVVAEAKDFTGSEVGVRDVEGHGTHVASTIAGRGTVSKGRFTGVAKGATLLIGKVCGPDGCPEDAILAGMEWAAVNGAKVVNLSLGGPPSDGGDLLEDAVNHQTAADGMLFVVAAGNDGPDPETIGSPGTADAALTVGSVTKAGQLSEFSSQGPRVGPSRRFDYAVKPDVTAPGQDIVAARAAGTHTGVPGNPQYTTMSGTSMATPHVAGAAAILAGKYPKWTPGQLKAALMATAAPRPELTVYQQGTGRIDVGRAVTQTVQANVGSLSLGYFPWPNDDAPTVRKTVTYTNAGSAPVTLALDLAVAKAPAGMFAVSPPTLTVAAGRSATATVTVTPAKAPAGLYSGALTATGPGGTVVRTAIGAYQEPESYNLSITTLNRAGGPGASEVMIADVATGRMYFDSVMGGLVRRLPAGRYTVAAATYDPARDGETSGHVTTAVRNVQVGRSNEVVLDARRAKPLTIGLDRGDAAHGTVTVSVAQRTGGAGGGGQSVNGRRGELWAEPSGDVPGMEFVVSTVFVKKGSDTGETPTPYTYWVTQPVQSRIPANLAFRYGARDFATVKRVVARQGAGEHLSLYSIPVSVKVPGTVPVLPLGGLRSRDDHHLTVPGVGWVTTLESTLPGGGAMTLTSPLTMYPPGQHVERWNTAVFGPSFEDEPGLAPARTGDVLEGRVPVLGDSQPGRVGWPADEDTGQTVLKRDGKVVMTTPAAGTLDATTVPAGAASYRLETTLRRAGASALSARVSVAWTFKSERAAKPVVLPLGVVRYSPALDDDNRAPAAGIFTIPLRYERAPGAAAVPLKSIAVHVSYDGGKTWTPATMSGTGDRRVATVRHPGKAGHAALRVTAVDTAGNSVEQAVFNAYALK